MGARVVEGIEVVVDGLDLRPLGHVEAQPDEDVLDLAAGLGHQVQAPDGRKRVSREGHVDAVGDEALLELGAGQLAAPGFDGGLERLARLVGRLAGRGPLLGRELGDAAQEVGQLGLAAQVAHADLLERGRRGRRGDRVAGLLLDLRNPIRRAHQRAILDAS